MQVKCVCLHSQQEDNDDHEVRSADLAFSDRSRKENSPVRPITTDVPGLGKVVQAPRSSDGGESDTAAPYDGDVEYSSGPASSSRGHMPLSLSVTTPKDVPSESYNVLMGVDQLRAARPEITPVASSASIRQWVHAAIFTPAPERPYRINPPPQDRPVRIYADGVYDLFHYAHMLQLRQAKLSFPSVYLIVGVVSSELCEQHKNRPILESSERYEALRNCRWVDEVLEDAPWVIQPSLVEKLQIDYVAHDELPYAMSTGQQAASSDVYDWLKCEGKFLPTRRTEGISTSDLVARIVSMYRDGELDAKLEKMGEGALASKSR